MWGESLVSAPSRRASVTSRSQECQSVKLSREYDYSDEDTEAGESYTSSSDEAWVFDFSGYSESEVFLAVYDLDERYTGINTVLENVVGMGAFHLGVIVYGVEYSFGTEAGVFWTDNICQNDAHEFREIIPLGPTPYTKKYVRSIAKRLAVSWRQGNYDLLYRNCGDFAVAFTQAIHAAEPIPEQYFTLAKRVALVSETAKAASSGFASWVEDLVRHAGASRTLPDSRPEGRRPLALPTAPDSPRRQPTPRSFVHRADLGRAAAGAPAGRPGPPERPGRAPRPSRQERWGQM